MSDMVLKTKRCKVKNAALYFNYKKVFISLILNT